jgi:hypothetical protein
MVEQISNNNPAPTDIARPPAKELILRSIVNPPGFLLKRLVLFEPIDVLQFYQEIPGGIGNRMLLQIFG